MDNKQKYESDLRASFADATLAFIEDWRTGRLYADAVCETLMLVRDQKFSADELDMTRARGDRPRSDGNQATENGLRASLGGVALAFIEDWQEGRLSAIDVCETLLMAAISRKLASPTSSLPSSASECGTKWRGSETPESNEEVAMHDSLLLNVFEDSLVKRLRIEPSAIHLSETDKNIIVRIIFDGPKYTFPKHHTPDEFEDFLLTLAKEIKSRPRKIEIDAKNLDHMVKTANSIINNVKPDDGDSCDLAELFLHFVNKR
jgi:hypothetical protein